MMRKPDKITIGAAAFLAAILIVMVAVAFGRAHHVVGGFTRAAPKAGHDPSFTFSTDAPSPTWQCSVDGKAFTACSSPQALTLAAGKHTVDMRATFTIAASAAPSASFTVSPAAPVTGQAVTFTAGTSPDCPCTFAWSDDDGPTRPVPATDPLGSGNPFSFTFHGVGTKFVRLVVTGTDGKTATVEHNVNVTAATSSSTSTTTSSTTTSSTTTTSTTTSPPPPPSSTVGVGGAPVPSCTSTVAVNGDVASAVSGAASGATVCLASGTWSHFTLGASTNTVTLASATPGGAQVAGISLDSPTSNLTVEGLQMNGGFKLDTSMSNDSFLFNSIENYGNGSGDAQLDAAFYSFPQEAGPANASVTGVTVEFNQMDHLPQCLEINTEGGDSSQNAWTFSHNVCGPSIGNNEPNDVHYTQEEGTTNLTMDNNAFLGPPAPVGSSHLNVAHICGDNVQFNNNIVYRTETVGQAFLAGDDCALTNSQASNNLFVEDNTANTFSMWIDSAHGSTGDTMSNNTIVNPTQYGAMLVEVSGFTAHGNLCASVSCYSLSGGTVSNNAANDGSGDVSWSPAWLTTTWTPNSTGPWQAPPAGYYQPSSLASSFGYQAPIGP